MNDELKFNEINGVGNRLIGTLNGILNKIDKEIQNQSDKISIDKKYNVDRLNTLLATFDRVIIEDLGEQMTNGSLQTRNSINDAIKSINEKIKTEIKSLEENAKKKSATKEGTGKKELSDLKSSFEDNKSNTLQKSLDDLQTDIEAGNNKKEYDENATSFKLKYDTAIAVFDKLEDGETLNDVDKAREDLIKLKQKSLKNWDDYSKNSMLKKLDNIDKSVKALEKEKDDSKKDKYKKEIKDKYEELKKYGDLPVYEELFKKDSLKMCDISDKLKDPNDLHKILVAMNTYIKNNDKKIKSEIDDKKKPLDKKELEKNQLYKVFGEDIWKYATDGSAKEESDFEEWKKNIGLDDLVGKNKDEVDAIIGKYERIAKKRATVKEAGEVEEPSIMQEKIDLSEFGLDTEYELPKLSPEEHGPMPNISDMDEKGREKLAEKIYHQIMNKKEDKEKLYQNVESNLPVKFKKGNPIVNWFKKILKKDRPIDTEVRNRIMESLKSKIIPNAQKQKNDFEKSVPLVGKDLEKFNEAARKAMLDNVVKTGKSLDKKTAYDKANEEMNKQYSKRSRNDNDDGR